MSGSDSGCCKYFKELLRISVFRINLLFGLFAYMIVFSCSLSWNESSNVTFSYMHVDIFNQVHPTLLFCPSYSEKTSSSFQMILLY